MRRRKSILSRLLRSFAVLWHVVGCSQCKFWQKINKNKRLKKSRGFPSRAQAFTGSSIPVSLHCHLSLSCLDGFPFAIPLVSQNLLLVPFGLLKVFIFIVQLESYFIFVSNIIVRQSHSLQSVPPDTYRTHLAPYLITTILSTTFPTLYFTSP